MFVPLSFPKTNLKLSRANGEVYVWCIARKKKLVLTPEEWVRQHVIHYLVNHKSYPIGLVASEMAIKVNELQRRCDVVIFSKEAKPVMIVECKATDVPIDEKTLFQIAQYNYELQVNYLFLTNGKQWVVCKLDTKNKKINYLSEIPDYNEIVK